MSDAAADTNLDAIASQVRSHPVLSAAEITPLLTDVRSSPRGRGFDTLVRHHLGIALDAAIARRKRGLDVIDLYQEGSIAVCVAIEEYGGGGRDATGLRRYVEKVVALHLEAAIEREAEAVRQEQELIRDAELLQAAEVRLRRELGRPATDLEVSGLLRWPIEKTTLVAATLHTAESTYDAELLPYLEADADRDDQEEAD